MGAARSEPRRRPQRSEDADERAQRANLWAQRVWSLVGARSEARTPMSLLPARTDRIVVMGVLNVTPDSFSDGGRYPSVDAAVAHAVEMRASGADLIDVGGESTRPGAQRVDAAEEIRRVLPVIECLVQERIPLSVDTYRAEVAAAALQAGAYCVNDVSGGLGDADMLAVVRDAGCPWILMHWRGHSASMQQLAHYDDVVADV